MRVRVYELVEALHHGAPVYIKCQCGARVGFPVSITRKRTLGIQAQITYSIKSTVCNSCKMVYRVEPILGGDFEVIPIGIPNFLIDPRVLDDVLENLK